LAVSGLFAQTINISGNYLDLLDNPIDSASVYYYQDQVVVDSTLTSSSGAFDLQFIIVSVNPSLPSSFQLSQNYPNPFNPSTRINLSIQEGGSFSIYNLRGALVESLDLPSAGSYELSWGGRNLGAGLYIYVLRSGKQASSRKMILLDGGDGSELAANQVSYASSSSLAKPASNDALRFEKYNTSSLEIDFFTPQADTTLGVLHGNVGPRQIQTIADTIMYEGDTLQVDWDDYFYNDSETYYPPRFVEFMYLDDTTFYDTRVIAIDVLDTNLITESNTFRMTWLSVNDPPSLTLTSLIESVVYDPYRSVFPKNIATFSYVDPDTNDVHTIFIINDSPSNAYFSIVGDTLKLDSLSQDFEGNINAGIRVIDQVGGSDSQTYNLEVIINYIPFLYFNGFVDTVQYNSTLPRHLASFNYEDFDGDDISFSLLNNQPDNAFMRVETVPFPQIFLDSLSQDFSGMVNYGVRIIDSAGQTDSIVVPLTIMPQPDEMVIDFIFKAVYDDTLLVNGTSTLKYRLMNFEGTDYVWDQDSILTSENGIVTALLLQGQNYSIRARHTGEEDDLLYPASFYKIPGVIGTVGQESWNMHSGADTLNVMNFGSNVDTVNVLKISEDFPLNQIRAYVDPWHEGTRKLPDSLLDVPFIGYLNYTALNESQIAAVNLFISDWSSIPQIDRTGHFYQTADLPEPPFAAIALDAGNQYASNIAHWDNSTNLISVASVNGKPYITASSLNQELAEAIVDAYDIGGWSPDWVSNDGSMTEFGKQTHCIVYLSKPGTYFF